MHKITKWALAWLAMAAASHGAQAWAETAHTQFGVLSVSQQQVLQFNGKPVVPAVVGQQGLSLGPVWDMGDTVVVLSTNHGGPACAERLNLIVVTPGKALASPTFGRCERPRLLKHQQRTVVVEVDGPQGAHQYVFADAVLTDNGQVVSDRFRSVPFSVPAITDAPGGSAPVHQGPGSHTPTVAQIAKGEIFHSHPQPGTWWQVRTANGLAGYVRRDHVLMARDF